MNERKPKEKLHQPAITGNVCAFFLALALADFLNDNYTFFSVAIHFLLAQWEQKDANRTELNGEKSEQQQQQQTNKRINKSSRSTDQPTVRPECHAILSCFYNNLKPFASFRVHQSIYSVALGRSSSSSFDSRCYFWTKTFSFRHVLFFSFLHFIFLLLSFSCRRLFSPCYLGAFP